MPSALPDTAVCPAAVLWDFDGTLVDTEKYWVDAEFTVLARYGVPWTQAQGKALAGSSWPESMAEMIAQMRRHGVQPVMEPEQLYRQVYLDVVDQIRRKGLPWLPGAQELLRQVQSLGVPQALVSASPIQMLDAGLDIIGVDTFVTVVDGTQLTRPKPDPQGYLMACERIGVSPDQCIVLEDSVPGCAAGVNAGAMVLAIPNQVPLPELPHQTILHRGLAGVDWDELCRLFAALRASDATPSELATQDAR